jgi:uncharacterized phage-associated protein
MKIKAGSSKLMRGDKKLNELVLYISEKSKDDPSFGAIKLNKILFASDFYFFGSEGRSITGAKYVHQSKGPVPHRMPAILANLEQEKRAEIVEGKYFGYSQKRIIPFGKGKGANLSIFTDDEISFVDEVIEYFRPYNASQLSEWTHKLFPWLATQIGEEIPYEAIFVLKRMPIEQTGINWAKKEIERLKKDYGYST